jgi:hypothetical protein
MVLRDAKVGLSFVLTCCGLVHSLCVNGAPTVIAARFILFVNVHKSTERGAEIVEHLAVPRVRCTHHVQDLQWIFGTPQQVDKSVLLEANV